MAIIELSGMFSHVRGSIAGTTFQRSASGLTARKKPIPVGRGTNQQNAQKNIIAQLNYEWNQLTDAQRTLWASFASYTNGVGKTNRQRNSGNTGKTQFVAVNSWLLLYGVSIVVEPSLVPPEAPISPYYNASFQSDNLGKTVGSLDTTQQILVTQVSLAQSVGTVTNNTGFRTLVYNQVDGTTQDWSGAFLNTYGVALTPGRKYWVQLQVVNFVTGTISAKSRALILLTGSTPAGIGTGVIGSTLVIG